MPLRPALVAFHPRGPEPKSVRKVNCPHCGNGFEISKRALSIRCPQCTRPLQFSDLTLKQRVQGDVATMGHVQLDGHGEMNGRLVCGQLTITGSFEGQATVYGQIELVGQSLTTGQLVGKALRVSHGATLRCGVTICPQPKADLGPALRRLQKPRALSHRRLAQTTTFEPVH